MDTVFQRYDKKEINRDTILPTTSEAERFESLTKAKFSALPT